jgi:hypothetical protein
MHVVEEKPPSCGMGVETVDTQASGEMFQQMEGLASMSMTAEVGAPGRENQHLGGGVTFAELNRTDL